ncbi:cell division protein FtsW [Salipaludibacillus neizhouensis]|uniref:Cell division protein FtsW n=1 Tax=Salipaludibacillus neizhouensis TaxID=885475 RepID=A0A3A9K3R5_9BACI|nr:FtsW/RodA/SpoVE family cell cycle protein [Salipaludibacillus neizhouensis]RKL67277.1 cell division protein FtsW [Salipaludibacillus neizhouensis]
MSSSKFEEFLNKVTSKVKSKEAHSMIKKELTNHLQELSQSFQKREPSKEEADEQAIQEMGNPFTIGENLNRLHKPKMDWVLVVLFIIIAAISFLPLVGGIPGLGFSGFHFIELQAIWLILAVLVIIGFLFFDYQKLKNLWIYFYGTGLLLLLYTYSFGNMINGATRSISIGGFPFDVTITLFLFFLAWAGIFNKIKEFNSWKKYMLLFFLFWTPILIYMMLPHFWLSIIYFLCILTMFAFSHAPKKLAMKLLATNIAAGLIIVITMIITSRGTFFFTRLLAFINPDTDPYGDGYMYMMIRDLLSQAGWFGKGLYNDINNESLPAAHTDFVFPYLVYSLGWAFGIVLCLILLLFISRIASNAFKTKDQFGRLLVIGGATLFTVPACWNILMGLGIFPIIGASLPFISYGGDIFYAAILGLILNVYRRKDIVEPTIVKLE